MTISEIIKGYGDILEGETYCTTKATYTRTSEKEYDCDGSYMAHYTVLDFDCACGHHYSHRTNSHMAGDGYRCKDCNSLVIVIN